VATLALSTSEESVRKKTLTLILDKELENNRRIACKMIKHKAIKERMKKYLIQELDIMMNMDHPNILRFLEAKKTQNNIYIFMEFCNGRDLSTLLELKDGKLSENLVRKIIKQVASGLQYLNEKGVMHRDLKLANILVHFPEYSGKGSVSDVYIEEFDHEEEDIEIVIGDLGFAKSVQGGEITTSYCGTPLNMAPEVMNGDQYTSQVDIWSLGTIIYELLVGFAPFIGEDARDLANRINKGDYGVPKNVKLSLNCIDLLSKCLQHQPERRISHDDVLDHPFFQEDDNCEKINLSVSRGPDQYSFFDTPSDSFKVTDKNSVMFNARESDLFNQHYSKAMTKYKKKQEEGKAVIQEPEMPQDLYKSNIRDAREFDFEFTVQDDSDEEEKIPEDHNPRGTVQTSKEDEDDGQADIEESKLPEINRIPSFACQKPDSNKIGYKFVEENKSDSPQKISNQGDQVSPKRPPSSHFGFPKQPSPSTQSIEPQEEPHSVPSFYEGHAQITSPSNHTEEVTEENKQQDTSSLAFTSNETGPAELNRELSQNSLNKANSEKIPKSAKLRADPELIEYSIIDKPEGLTLSMATNNQFNTKNEEQQEDLEASFEIISSNDILMLPTKDYYSTLGCKKKEDC